MKSPYLRQQVQIVETAEVETIRALSLQFQAINNYATPITVYCQTCGARGRANPRLMNRSHKVAACAACRDKTHPCSHEWDLTARIQACVKCGDLWRTA